MEEEEEESDNSSQDDGADLEEDSASLQGRSMAMIVMRKMQLPSHRQSSSGHRSID